MLLGYCTSLKVSSAYAVTGICVVNHINQSRDRHCKKSDFLFVKSTGEMLRVKSEMYFLV